MHKNFAGYGVFDGQVVKIGSVEDGSTLYHIRYQDGNKEDYKSDDMAKKQAKQTSQVPTRRDLKKTMMMRRRTLPTTMRKMMKMTFLM